MEYIAAIKSLTNSDGFWFQVSGTKDNPKIERVVLWAVIEKRWRNRETGELEGISEDLIVGVLSHQIGISGNFPDTFTQFVAGYVRLTEAELRNAILDPTRLPDENLVWE